MRQDILRQVMSEEEMKDLKNLMATFMSLDRVGQLLILNSASTLKMAQNLGE